MARTKDSPSYITTSISKLLALGIDKDEPLNMRRLDIQALVANNLEKFLAVEPKIENQPEESEDNIKVEAFEFDKE